MFLRKKPLPPEKIHIKSIVFFENLYEPRHRKTNIVVAGRKPIMLVLSWRGSYYDKHENWNHHRETAY
jgi:hypothetical protein